MSEAQKIAPAGSGQETTQQTNLLDTIVEEGRFGKEPASQERGKDIIKEFIGQVLQGEVTVSKDTEAMINARIAGSVRPQIGGDQRMLDEITLRATAPDAHRLR